MTNTPDNSNVPIITIDGPGGVGKGSTAKRIASTLGWHLLDSGMLYRLLALSAINHQVAADNQANLEIMAAALDIKFVAHGNEEGVQALLEGEDVTTMVRTEDVGMMASRVAALPSVRAALLARQHAFVEPPGLVADGRDMGTIVFTKAPLKIYLNASVEVRAERRYKQLLDKGQSGNLARLAESIAARDKSDMERTVAPLKPATDAVCIDSTQMTIEQVCNQILREAKQRNLLAN